MEDTNLGNNSSCAKSPEHPEHMLESEGVEIGSTEYEHGCSNSELPQCPAEAGSNLGKLDTQKVTMKNSRRLSHYGKKIATRDRGKTYLLRSSFNSSRVLRSMSKAAIVTPPLLNDNPVNHVKEKKKRRKKTQRSSDDEFSKIMRSVRYLLHRMSYEQSLIDAYAGGGWKGQSSEKIKPEMELQRAKSEILRCKLKIRNVFQQLDSSISEGKLDDSLFDSEGEICSDDIFCAKCRRKDVSLDNDIILCDGICDRGFHQMCLDPPLLKDDIPSGDDGWLCPGCDCKVDCLDLLNDTQGTDLSIEDEWEKVFPEATAIASKNGQHDGLELPSDDSEDDDYDTDNIEDDQELEEGSSSDESDFTSTSEDSGPSNRNLHDQNFGFPSDDSEDIDYEPDKPDLKQKAAEDSSSSDESDFTSDTDDLNVPDNDASDVNEVSVSPVSKYPESFSYSGKEIDAEVANKSSAKSMLCPLESEMGQEIVVPLSGKRHRERLDYKKLYDEEYGNNLSDSSDDDEWTEMSTPNKLNHNATREDTKGVMENHVGTVENRRSAKRIKGKQNMQDKYGVCAEMTENHQKTKTCRELRTGLANHSADQQRPDFAQPDTGERKTSQSGKYGAAASQKLQVSFGENQYPSREIKESLAGELNMTVQQVSKWFGNARHRFRVLANEMSPAGPGSVCATSCGETTNVSIQESVGSIRPSKGRQLKKLGESRHVNMSETRNDREKKEKAIGGSISREILVMRELRKRRLSK